MKRVLAFTVIAAMSFGSAGVFAQEKKPEVKKVEGHCEKTNDDGSVEDIEAKDKADCKAKGGKWNKAKKGEKHTHGK